MIWGIILAAGASRRMGAPKALLDYRGETFLDRLIRVVGIVAEPLVVLGYRAEVVQAGSKNPAKFVVNPDPRRGQLSSLQTALAAAPTDFEGFLFIPVDCPAVAEETVRRLAAAFARRDPATLFVIPRCGQGRGQKRGHPVFAAPPIAREILALPPTDQARDVVHRHVPDTLYVDVDDAGILADIDDPAAYRQLIEAAL
ncbi:MAG TPA: nucleotidyltransferase family protein [Bryobacteraceae bacterium]